MGENDTTMSINAHIGELRKRLFVLAAIFIVASTIAYVFREDIAHLLMAPLEGQKLYNLTPGGQFSFILKIIMWAGLAATIPFFVASLYSFIAPALPKQAQRHAPKILFFSMILLCAGAVFGYVYAIPGAMRFLLSFADGLVTPMITGESYLNFVLAYTVGLGVLFQIPLIMIIANWVTPLKPKFLLNMERYVIVIAFVAAAIITPTPDPTNQAIIAAPVIAMYQVGFAAILVSLGTARRKRRSSRASADASGRVVATVASAPAAIAAPPRVVSQPGVAHVKPAPTPAPVGIDIMARPGVRPRSASLSGQRSVTAGRSSQVSRSPQRSFQDIVRPQAARPDVTRKTGVKPVVRASERRYVDGFAASYRPSSVSAA